MKCFAIMPFAAEFNDVYSVLDDACIESAKRIEKTTGVAVDVTITRVDKHKDSSNVVQQILDGINDCDVCIADLTGNRPNVLYELGYGMGLGKPVIIITQARTTVGFDLDHIRNIEYERDDLKKTLFDDAAEFLCSTWLQVAHTSPLTSNVAHARMLATMTATPCYFLDAKFQIKYMNAAAINLFEVDSTEGYWVGRPLSEFMNSFDDRLTNLPAIEKNLQIQIERIQRSEREGRPNAIKPYDFELVSLMTTEYGHLDLQKTAVAVRDPDSEQITGWVVSFNALRSNDASGLKKFHDKHTIIVQGRLSQSDISSPGMAKKAAATATRDHEEAKQKGGRVQSWLANGMLKYRIERAKNYEEKQACFSFAADVLPEYGLTSVKHLPEYFFDYRRTEYLKLLSSDGDLVGVFRLHLAHSIQQYEKIEQWVLDLAAEEQLFADAGAYLPRYITGKHRRDCLAILLGHAAYRAEALNNPNLYAQVPSDDLAAYEKLEFKRAGVNFICPGWGDQSWSPIVLKCVVYREPPPTDDDGLLGSPGSSSSRTPPPTSSNRLLEIVRAAYKDAEDEHRNGD